MGNCIIISRRSRLGNAQPSDVISGKTFSNSSNSGLTCTLALTGTASASQVLSGQTFYSDSTIKQTGSMPNNGAWSTTINPGGSVTIPSGYHSGGGRVSASKNSLVPSSVVSTSGGNGVELTTNSKLVTVGTLGFDWDHPQAQIQLYFDGSWKNADSYGLVRSTRIYDSNPGATYSVWVNTSIIDKIISKVRVVGIWDGDISKCDICAFKGS